MSKTLITAGLSLLSAFGWPGRAGAIPAPSAWYKADTLGLAHGAPVNSWNDSSANGLHLTTRNQGVDMTITYNVSAPALNNMPAVHWPGGSPTAIGSENHTYIRHAATSYLASTELTIFAVGTWTQLSQAAVVSVYDTTHGCPEWGGTDLDSSMEDGAMIGYMGQSAWHHNFMSNYAGVSGSGNTTSIIEGLFGTAPEDTRVYIDGVLGSYPPSTSSNASSGTQHLLGDLDEIPPSDRGIKLGHADFWHVAWPYPTMDLAEVIIYNRKLTDQERIEVGAYLAAKYNLSTAYGDEPEPDNAPAAWYDAGDLGLANGANVDSWPDKSGHYLNLATRNQGSDMTLTYVASSGALNGLPAVRWPGGTPAASGSANHTYMRHSPHVALAGDSYTIFAVGTFASLGNSAIVGVLDNTSGDWGYPDTDDNMREEAMIGYAGNIAWHHTTMGHYQNASGGAATGGYILEGLFGTSPADTMVYVNGNVGTLGGPSGSPVDYAYISRGIKLGHADFWHTNWHYPTMDLAEVIIYNQKLPGGARNKIGSELQAKYNISGSYVNPRIYVQESGWTTQVDEEGPTSDSYTVEITDRAPTASVYVTVSPDIETEVNGAGSGNPAQLTFSTENWDTPQTVTVTAIDDSDVEGAHTSVIQHASASADAYYSGVAIDTVTAEVADNDVGEVLITESEGSTQVDEEGPTSDTYSLVLSKQPLADVLITVDPDDQVEVNSAGADNAVELTFTTLNWQTAQTVTVTAIDDEDFEPGSTHDSVIVHTLASSDPAFSPIYLSIADVVAAVLDNDERGCYEPGAAKALANTDLVDMEELAVVAGHWLEPDALGRGKAMDMEAFGELAAEWLTPDEQQLWFDDALPLRVILALWGGSGTGKWPWDVALSNTTQWNWNLTTWQSEGYNGVVYLAGHDLTGNEQVFLRLDEFPEAKQTDESVIATNVAQLQWLFARAKQLGMYNLMYTLSVYWTHAFGNAHGLNQPMTVDEVTVSWYHNAYPDQGYNRGVYTSLTAAYSESVWAEFSRTFEDLDAYYSPIGEAVPNLRRAQFYQEAIAPGLECTGGRTSPKPLIIAHNWQMNISDWISGIGQSGAYDNVWLGYHAYNGEQICDAKPKPDIITWASQTGMPTVVMVYPANSEAWPFNSPQLAAEIIAEMKKIPHIKGFVYWEHSGRLLSPLFRKALGYYSSTSEAYSDEPWLDILDAQFGTRTAAEHFLNAWNASGRIMAEECAMIYDEADWAGGEKELTLPYTLIDSRKASTSPNRNMVSIQSYAQTIASNPGYNFGAAVTPPQQMAMIKTLGQQAFDEATAAIPYVTQNLSEAQDALTWMEGFKLISAYFELKVNAATAALIYKYGGGSSYRTQAESLAQQAYDAYIAASDHLIANCRPIFQALYSTDLKTPNGPTLEVLRTNELNDKNNIGSIFGAW